MASIQDRVHLLEFNRLAVLANYIDKNATGDFVVSGPMGDAQDDLVTNIDLAINVKSAINAKANCQRIFLALSPAFSLLRLDWDLGAIRCPMINSICLKVL